MKAWFDMFREALFTVLCNTLFQKRERCFCRKGWCDEELFSCYQSLDEVNCARRSFDFFLACSPPTFCCPSTPLLCASLDM